MELENEIETYRQLSESKKKAADLLKHQVCKTRIFTIFIIQIRVCHAVAI